MRMDRRVIEYDDVMMISEENRSVNDDEVEKSYVRSRIGGRTTTERIIMAGCVAGARSTGNYNNFIVHVKK